MLETANKHFSVPPNPLDGYKVPFNPYSCTHYKPHRPTCHHFYAIFKKTFLFLKHFPYKKAPCPFWGKEPYLFYFPLIRFFGKLKLIFGLKRRAYHIPGPHIVARGMHLVYRVRNKLAIYFLAVKLVYLICIINIARL